MQLTVIQTDILQAALLAPSADNHHRLRFEPTVDGVIVWSEPGRLRSLTGYKRTLDLLSLGTVIENISLRAGAHNLSASIALLPPDQIDLVARIQFQSTPCAPDPLHTAIPIRHTNRRFFKSTPVAEDILTSIANAAREVPGSTLEWLDQPESRRQALRLIRCAEGERFHLQALHAEMFENIRFDVGWKQSCDEALPPGSLEVESFLRPFFKLMRHWPVMRSLNLLGAYKQLAWRAGDLPCRLSPHLGVISAPSLEDRDQINAGRAFQRAWLSIAQHGLALQPMPASVLYAQTAAVHQGIPHELQAYLNEGWDRLQPGKVPLMVFRIGEAIRPSVTSGRRALENYLIR